MGTSFLKKIPEKVMVQSQQTNKQTNKQTNNNNNNNNNNNKRPMDHIAQLRNQFKSIHIQAKI